MALASLSTISTLVIAWQISEIVSGVFIERTNPENLIDQFLNLAIAGLMKGTCVWLQELLSTRAATAVQIQLRSKFLSAVQKLGSDWLRQQSTGEINLLATSGLEALDAYFSKYVPQLIYAAVISPVIVLLVWSQDLTSGIMLVATMPLVPLFMALIGWSTRTAQTRQLDAMTRLTQHFLEVLRGTTTLKVYRRENTQVATIAAVSEQNRQKTMQVLKITFLSGFALELISSLSVALIAVSIGLRLVNGEVSLLVGLFVLLLAPEAFLPLRQIGAYFHAAAEGVTAVQKVLDVIQQANSKFSGESFQAGLAVSRGEITVLVGPSGAGKSSLFRRELGLTGAKPQFQLKEVSWMPQRPALFAGTVLENITGSSNKFDMAALQESLRLAALDDLSLETNVGQDGSNISGGQAQRVSLARCFYRAINSNSKYLFLDEPTSALDSNRASIVVQSLRDMASIGKAVVAITHQKSLVSVADKVIEVNNA